MRSGIVVGGCFYRFAGGGLPVFSQQGFRVGSQCVRLQDPGLGISEDSP